MSVASSESNTSILNKKCFSKQSIHTLNLICAEKMKRLNLSVFEFARVYDNGRAILLYSDPKISQYLFKHQVHITAHVPTSLISSEFWYLPAQDGPYSQFLRDMKDISKAGSFVDYIQRFEGYFDMYCYWSPLDQNSGSSHFINSKEKLEQLSNEFKEQAGSFIASVETDPFIVPQLMRPNFGGLPKKNMLINDKIDFSFYLDKILKNLKTHRSAGGIQFANRELDCIRFLIFGKTAKDISIELGLSIRTIEHRIDSLRDKLGCKKKSDIVERFFQLASER